MAGNWRLALAKELEYESGKLSKLILFLGSEDKIVSINEENFSMLLAQAEAMLELQKVLALRVYRNQE